MMVVIHLLLFFKLVEEAVAQELLAQMVVKVLLAELVVPEELV
jgi:hypothetical protein